MKDDGSSELSVLEGSVEVEPLQDGSPSGAPVTTVEAGQRLRFSASGVILALLQLTDADYRSVLNGPLFSGFTSTLPGYAALESHIRSSLPAVTLPPPPTLPATPVLPSIPGLRLF